MEKRVLIFFTALLGILAAIVVVTGIVSPDIHRLVMAFSGEESLMEESKTDQSILIADNVTDSTGKSHSVRLAFPADADIGAIEHRYDFLNKQLLLHIPGVDKDYPDNYPIRGADRELYRVTYTSLDRSADILFDFTYYTFYSSMTEGRYLYLDFKRPRQIYDTIVVLDPGHGGDDNGNIGYLNADSDNEIEILEKDINLSLSSSVLGKLESANENIGVFATRSEDIDLSDEERIAFIEDIGADVCVSIHQNSTSSGRISDRNGTEVKYLYSDSTGKSKEFAGRLLENLVLALGTENRGLLAGDDLAILRESNGITAQVELGYMSNPLELLKLTNPEYQNNAAQALTNTILEIINEKDFISNR